LGKTQIFQIYWVKRQATLDASMQMLIKFVAVDKIDLSDDNFVQSRLVRRWFKTYLGSAPNRPQLLHDMLVEFDGKVQEVQEEYACAGRKGTGVPLDAKRPPLLDPALNNSAKLELLFRALTQKAPYVHSLALTFLKLVHAVVNQLQEDETKFADLQKELDEHKADADAALWIEDFKTGNYGTLISLFVGSFGKIFHVSGSKDRIWQSFLKKLI